MKYHIPFWLIIFAFTPTFILHAQIITNFAGNHTVGYSGDGGPATAAQFNNPYGIVMSKAGDLFICDYRNDVVRKVNATGIISTYAGNSISGYSGDGGPATNAQLNGPISLALDTFGNLYIGDNDNSLVRKVTPAGIISTFAGRYGGGPPGDGGPATAAALSGTFGLAVDSANNVYISAGINIRKVNTSGIITTIAGAYPPGYSGDGGPATAARFSNICGLAIKDTTLFLCDNQNHTIRKINLGTGIVTAVAGDGSMGFSGPTTAARLNIPENIVLKGSDLYIGDRNNFSIRKVDTAGIITNFAGSGVFGHSGDGGPAIAAKLKNATALAVDIIGNIYVCEQISDVIRKIDTTTNRYPAFVFPGTISVCSGSPANNIDTILSVYDSDNGQTETWIITAIPFHGTLGGFSSTTISTGGMLIPSGLTYTPTAGYIGTDSFTVSIFRRNRYYTSYC